MIFVSKLRKGETGTKLTCGNGDRTSTISNVRKSSEYILNMSVFLIEKTVVRREKDKRSGK